MTLREFQKDNWRALGILIDPMVLRDVQQCLTQQRAPNLASEPYLVRSLCEIRAVLESSLGNESVFRNWKDDCAKPHLSKMHRLTENAMVQQASNRGGCGWGNCSGSEFDWWAQQYEQRLRATGDNPAEAAQLRYIAHQALQGMAQRNRNWSP